MNVTNSNTSDFPTTMGKVAIRELQANGINSVDAASQYGVKELLSIHGVGPKAIKILHQTIGDELVDVIDERNTILYQERKVITHKLGLLHKTAIGFLKYGEDFALVRQGSDRQDAGQLVAPVGGHIQADETDLDGLIRECEEEIGTANVAATHIGNAHFRRKILGRDENHLFIIYEIQTDDPINLGVEATSIERFTPTEFRQALLDEPHNFGESLYFSLEHFYPEYLPADYTFRWV